MATGSDLAGSVLTGTGRTVPVAVRSSDGADFSTAATRIGAAGAGSEDDEVPPTGGNDARFTGWETDAGSIAARAGELSYVPVAADGRATSPG